MQERPDNATVLMGMAQFLATEVRPALQDKGLSFRVLIASAVATSIALEQNGIHEREAEELDRLLELLGEAPTSGLTVAERRARIRELDTRLSRKLRDDDISEADFAAAGHHLKQSLAARLRAMNPRFDLRDQVESK